MRTLEFTAEDGRKVKIYHPEDILQIKPYNKVTTPNRSVNTVIYFRHTDNMLLVQEDYTHVSSSITKTLHKIEQDMDGQTPTINML